MNKNVHVTLSLPKEVKEWLYNSVEKGSFLASCFRNYKKNY